MMTRQTFCLGLGLLASFLLPEGPMRAATEVEQAFFKAVCSAQEQTAGQQLVAFLEGAELTQQEEVEAVILFLNEKVLIGNEIVVAEESGKVKITWGAQEFLLSAHQLRHRLGCGAAHWLVKSKSAYPTDTQAELRLVKEFLDHLDVVLSRLNPGVASQERLWGDMEDKGEYYALAYAWAGEVLEESWQQEEGKGWGPGAFPARWVKYASWWSVGRGIDVVTWLCGFGDRLYPYGRDFLRHRDYARLASSAHIRPRIAALRRHKALQKAFKATCDALGAEQLPEKPSGPRGSFYYPKGWLSLDRLPVLLWLIALLTCIEFFFFSFSQGFTARLVHFFYGKAVKEDEEEDDDEEEIAEAI